VFFKLGKAVTYVCFKPNSGGLKNICVIIFFLLLFMGIIFSLHSPNAKGDFVLTPALAKRHPKDSEPDCTKASNS
jgi:hypothetical protein